MIDLQSVVQIVVYLLVAAVVFGLLYWLVDKIGAMFQGSEPFVKIAKLILLILAVLICIGVLVSLVSGRPMFRWGERLF